VRKFGATSAARKSSPKIFISPKVDRDGMKTEAQQTPLIFQTVFISYHNIVIDMDLKSPRL
jgi:hypothetical protein